MNTISPFFVPPDVERTDGILRPTVGGMAVVLKKDNVAARRIIMMVPIAII